jgi:DNA-nicking Smr family endonuclease
VSTDPDPSPFGHDPVEIPINGELDLHSFRPQDLGELIPDYIEACRQKGIYKIRIVHGKGIGNLRRSVTAILQRHPKVTNFGQAGEQLGGWGAMIVELRRD